ncbi:hypothetical protein [Domibacillus epiphyticus]|uniref:Uncharacterized protein n=1 Tax=Domibacillus epiphyticus TaxID=1714355 RepID=A0A1V2A7S6_9BACI|nr:hypothetical protein [Domibacillus epiphyticus]OMP66997.1 hypothetical protein BTO28_08360 [Domibacillus epiphyticus]
MTAFPISLFVYMDICMCIGFYIYVFRKKKLIGFQLGMNISNVMGGMTALLSGIVLIWQFPFHFTAITILSALTGALTGALFGLLFDYQTFITGLTNGLMIGIMSPMLGAVLEVPFLFLLFLHGLFFATLVTILISIQRS